jgi:exodeoxyribonuclease V
VKAGSLSADQARVLRSIRDWFERPEPQVLTVGGYAGTGKTTLIGVLRNELEWRRRGLRVALASYTGKASRVLEAKVREAYARFPDDYVGTLHGLIYDRIEQKDGKITGWRLRKGLEHDLVIVDEASMVDEGLWRDLLSFGKRVIAVGDHGQLPPVQGKFHLLQSPDLELTRIHRQAAQNPILRLSEQVRKRGRLPAASPGPEIRLVEKDEGGSDFVERLFEGLGRDTLVLCASNRTRVELNRRIRAAQGVEGADPREGERVICLRNNWNAAPQPVCNGMLGTLLGVAEGPEPELWRAAIRMDGEETPYEGVVSRLGFNCLNPSALFSARRPGKKGAVDFFDFGYALTVHKAQGSEADHVVVFLEQLWSGDVWRRWLYTAVTRARETLVIVR